jgi:hypothetical protein
MPRDPLILYVREGDRKIYDELRRGGPLEGQETKVVFLLAMITGFLNKRSEDLGPNKDTYIRTEYLSDEEKTLIKAIAVQTEGKLEVLADMKDVYSIAERFAAGGIERLRSDLKSLEGGTYLKRLEVALAESTSALTKAQTATE